MNGIRAAGEADDGIVSDLLIDAFSDLYAATNLEMSAARRAYLSDQASRRAFATSYIYEDEETAVGTVTLVPPSEHCEAWIEGAWELRLLAVRPAKQGRGLARELVAYVEDQARGAGAAAICLHARRGMLHQARFYPSCGYIRDPVGDTDVQPSQDGYHKLLRPE